MPCWAIPCPKPYVYWALLEKPSARFCPRWVAKQVGLTLQKVQPFQVLVGNSEELECSFQCLNTELTLDGHHSLVDLYVRPLSGAELVLGV